jgi:NADH-quinone oxidoreductase subunit I
MSDMYGKGILKGLSVSLKRFAETYLDDLSWIGKRYRTDAGIAHRASKDARGIFTVQYPEEKIPVPEEFRFMPFLVYNEGPNGEKNLLCTSCGICAKVCPPQCIWIVRGTDPETKRPKPEPVEFTIDATTCMSCGYCAEFCPFDAIKMDQNYEMGTYDRWNDLVLTKDKLMKPDTYHYQIHPSAKDAEAANIAKSEKAKNR